MNEYILTIGAIWILFFSLASFVITAFFIVPLQVKEAKVKDGLAILRKILLTMGVVFDINNFIFAGIIITYFFFREYTIAVLLFALMLEAFLNFLFSILGYKMYHTQYTDEIKEAHKEMEKAHQEKDENV